MKIPRNERKAPKINTTALPDIIFMLLFFFMVTTSIQTSSAEYLELPIIKNMDTQAEEMLDELIVRIGEKEGEFYIEINGTVADIDQLDHIIATEIIEHKKKGIFNDKAILWIDVDIPMFIVNDLKESLQANELYSIEYIHLADHSY